jgi:hypothetical protein
MTISCSVQWAQKYVRISKPGSEGSIRVKINGLPHLEQGGRFMLTNLYAGLFAVIALFTSAFFGRIAS